MAQEIMDVDYDSPQDDTDLDYYSETDSDYHLTAQQHWEESMRQITGLVNMVLFPLLGKLLGRRFAHMMWAKYATWYYA